MVRNSRKTKALVVTHDGKFHADDVFAVASLKIFLKGEFKVVRTRDENLIKKADFVLDVGRVYNAKQRRFDHHQQEGAGKRKNGVPYASFGLIWKEYGEKISGSKKVSLEIDKRLVQYIDAEDNGVEVSKPLFDFFPYSVSKIIDSFNPTLEEKSTPSFFNKAVKLAEEIIEREIKKTKYSIKSQDLVNKIYRKSKDKRIIVLNKGYPSKSFLSTLPEPLFVIYPSEGGFWHVSAIKENNLSLKNRKSFPKSWAGKVGLEFQKESGVKDASFCHRNLFLVSTKSKKGALEIARIAIGE